jgi:hypothetical protein
LPAFGQPKADYLKNQYVRCAERASLTEAGGPQFRTDWNADAAAERVLFACQTEERALAALSALALDGETQADRFRLRLRNDIVRWFTEVAALARGRARAQRTPAFEQ